MASIPFLPQGGLTSAIPLRPAGVRELEALDSTWPNSTGTPDHYLHEDLGTTQIRLYKTPTAGPTTLAVVHQAHLANLALNDQIPLPRALADYLYFYVIAEARSAETDGAMPEAAEFARQLADLYIQLATIFWGTR